MKTPKELEEAFRKDLKELCEKHSATISLDLRGSSYQHYEVIQVDIDQKWDEEGITTSPGTSFDL
jgi:hypothetical protein